jgi:hypothetical protein
MAAQDDFNKAQKALDAGENFFYQGKSYTPAQIATQLLGAKGAITAAVKTEKSKKKAEKTATTQERRLDQRANKQRETALFNAKEELKLLENSKNFYLRGLNTGEVTEEEFNTYTATVGQVKRDINAMEAGALAKPVLSTTGYGRYEMLETGLSAGTTPQAVDRAEAERFGQTYLGQRTPLRITGVATPEAGGDGTPSAPTGGGTGGGGGGGAARPVTRQQVETELASSGLADTPQNRQAIRARLAAGDKAIANWEAEFRRQFPQYQYLLDQTVFGADMTALLQRAVLEKWYDSDELETLMEQGFSGTEYAQNTTTNQQNFDKLTPGNKQAQIDKFKLEIKQAYGNLQIDDASLANLATKAARDAKTGKALELFIYQEALAKPAGTNVYAMQTAATRALTSGEADRIRQIGRDYGFQLSNQEVEDVLTGRKTEDDLRQSYKIAARRWYKGVAEDLDAGLTIDQIFKPYRQYAAQILEKPLDQVDLVDAGGAPSIYSEALQGQDGPLSLTEWAQKLKSDPKYGYQYTAKANQEVSSVVRSLEKAFGFTR